MRPVPDDKAVIKVERLTFEAEEAEEIVMVSVKKGWESRPLPNNNDFPKRRPEEFFPAGKGMVSHKVTKDTCIRPVQQLTSALRTLSNSSILLFP